MIKEPDNKFMTCRISKSLYDEIQYAKDNLNEAEKNKKSGMKKHKWTFKEASKEIGTLLHSKRKSKKKSVFDLFH